MVRLIPDERALILLSHPTADDTARHAALALNRAGVLGEFWTCAANGNAPHPVAIQPASLLNTSARGNAPFGVRSDRRTPIDALRHSLDRMVSTRLACERFKGIYAYEDSADESFRIAGLRGMLRVYDLAGGHWQVEREICAEEASLEPEWSALLEAPRNGTASTRRESELGQADLVVVATTFLMRTVERFAPPSATIALLPPGAACQRMRSVVPATARRSHAKLRVLYIGELSQRKGLSYLFRACREMRHSVDLTIIGGPAKASCPALERELLDVRWLPACSEEELQAEIAAHDVLLAPSVFDGFDPVMLDAMAAGLPIIATPHTAAPDLIDHGIEGFIVPVRSSDDIVAKLELLCREPERRAAMSISARQRAECHSWENYERALAASVATALTRI